MVWNSGFGRYFVVWRMRCMADGGSASSDRLYDWALLDLLLYRQLERVLFDRMSGNTARARSTPQRAGAHVGIRADEAGVRRVRRGAGGAGRARIPPRSAEGRK